MAWSLYSGGNARWAVAFPDDEGIGAVSPGVTGGIGGSLCGVAAAGTRAVLATLIRHQASSPATVALFAP